MKKKLVSLLLCAVLLAGAVPVSAAAASNSSTATVFSDISDSETATAANALRSLGIISGTTDTTFSPDSPLTRAQICKILIGAMGLQDQVESYARKHLFSDVSSTSVFAGYINLAYTKGIFQGYGDGTFGPDNGITYGQLASVLLRMLGYTSNDVGYIWPTDYTAFCENLGLNGSLTLTPYQTLTRGQAVILICNALKADTASSQPYCSTINGVASTQTVTILDVDARQNDVTGLLRYYTSSNSGISVKYCKQTNPIPHIFVGYTGTLLLNSNGMVTGFLPDSCDSDSAVLLAADDDGLLTSEQTYALSDDAVIIIGDVTYNWSNTGYLQANCYLGEHSLIFRNDIGNISCVYIPVEDVDAASALTVVSTKDVLLVSTAAASGSASGEVMAFVIDSSSASVAYFKQAKSISAAQEGQIGTLLLNHDGDAVGFIASAQSSKDVEAASAKLSGIVDDSGVTHRISSNAAVIVGDSVYSWKDSGYLHIGNNTGKTVRLYYNDNGDVAYVLLFSGGTNAETEAILAETVTAASELARKLGISSTYSITKNGVSADADDLAQYDIAYYDSTSRTLRASDYQFTGYIESAYPNVSEAETITVSGCEFTVLESAWDSLCDYTLNSRVTLLLTDDLKVAMATTDSSIVSDILGILDTTGGSVTLLDSGLTMTASNIFAKESLYGGIVRVTVLDDRLYCHGYSSSSAGSLDIATDTLGSYELAPGCAVFEHTGSGSYISHVYSLSGEKGIASYDFSEIIWTDSIPASSVTAYHLNTAGKVDMLLLQDVTGNCYEYGMATKYTGSGGINLGTREVPAYNSAVSVTNADNHGEGIKRICSLYEAKTDTVLGVSPGTYDAAYQRVVSLKVLTKTEDLSCGDFFLTADTWNVTVDGAELPVSESVQVYIEAAEVWYSGEDGLKTALAMDGSITAYYDRTASTGAQIRVIVVED